MCKKMQKSETWASFLLLMMYPTSIEFGILPHTTDENVGARENLEHCPSNFIAVKPLPFRSNRTFLTTG